MYTNNILAYRRHVMAKFKMKKREDDLNSFIKWSKGTTQDPARLHKYGLAEETNIYLPSALNTLIKEGLNLLKNESKRISIKDYLKPSTLEMCWIASIIDHYLRSGVWALVELDMRYLNPDRLLKLIFHGKYDDEDQLYFGITLQNLKDARDKFITPFVKSYNHLVNYGYINGRKLDINNIAEKIDTAIEANAKEVRESLYDVAEPRWMLISDLQLIDKIKSLTSELIKDELLHVYTGYAGSGKSTKAIKSIPSGECISVTRSNTVGMELDEKYRRRHPDRGDFIPKSITAYNLSNIENVNVIIDEFSQWELHDLGTLKDILFRAKVYRKHVYILGDVLQMKGFISRGSLLEPYIQLYEKCGGHVDKQETPKRCSDVGYNEKILQYTKLGMTEHLSEYVTNNGSFEDITENDFENILSNGVILTDCSTGEDKFREGRGCRYANHLVLSYLAKQNNVYYESENDRNSALERLTKKGVKIKLLANQTCVMDKQAYKSAKDERERINYKLLTNERAVLTYNKQYIITLERRTEEGKEIFWKFDFIDDAMEYFTLGYAITVTRAQGLGWDHVIYVQDHKKGTNFEAFYVAMTRCKETSKCIVLQKQLRRRHFREKPASHFSIKSIDK